MIPNRVEALLDDLLADFKEILGDNLRGLYLHGSLAYGCFTWETGDVDLIVVAREPLTAEEQQAIIRAMLRRTPDAPPKGIEMSVVLEQHCREFVYPTPFEAHFSNFHLERCRRDPAAYCASMRGKTDRDLASHFAVIRQTGRAIFGEAPQEMFAPVPKSALMDSIRGDVTDLDFEENPTYAALNLCRALALAEEGVLLSKKSGGEWAKERLDADFAPLIDAALAAYRGENADMARHRADLERLYRLVAPHFVTDER